jgi:hypothetical protein
MGSDKEGDRHFDGRRCKANGGVACLIGQRCSQGIRALLHPGCKAEADGDNDRSFVHLEGDLREIQVPLNGVGKLDDDAVDSRHAFDLQGCADQIRIGGDGRIDMPSISDGQEEEDATVRSCSCRIGRGLHADAENGGGIAAAGREYSGGEQGREKQNKSQAFHPFHTRESEGTRSAAKRGCLKLTKSPGFLNPLPALAK